MPRLVYLTGVALFVVAAAYRLADWWVTPPPAVTYANLERIKVGMTLGRVKVILGQPDSRRVVARNGCEWIAGWYTDHGSVAVGFGEGDRVVWAFWLVPAEYVNEGLSIARKVGIGDE